MSGAAGGRRESTPVHYLRDSAVRHQPIARLNTKRHLAPTFRISLENEWYKAAYYSPNYGGIGVGGYYAYATQSNDAPGTTIALSRPP